MNINNVLNRPVTEKFLLEFTKKIILPEVGELLDDKLKKAKDEILTSNDRLSKKLDRILKEQIALTASYRRLEKRVNYLEAVVKVLAEKAGLPVNLNDFQD